MRIAYIVPGFGPCGGMRIIAEHVNRLSDLGHEMTVVGAKEPKWIDVNASFTDSADNVDLRVFTGWETVSRFVGLGGYLSDVPSVWFLQMAEWEFSEPGTQSRNVVLDTFRSTKTQLPIITIAPWVAGEIYARWGFEPIQVTNGVNTDHFYPNGAYKENLDIVLVEGGSRNWAKDTQALAVKVALYLKERYGVRIWSYAGYAHPFSEVYDRFLVRPSTNQIRDLYHRARFLLKASKYDARACAPVEAMACGTPVCRAILRGDPDLMHGRTAYRTSYSYNKLRRGATIMMEEEEYLVFLHKQGLRYARKHLEWSSIIEDIETLYCYVVANWDGVIDHTFWGDLHDRDLLQDDSE